MRASHLGQRGRCAARGGSFGGGDWLSDMALRLGCAAKRCDVTRWIVPKGRDG
jgi:hypothetical protein